MTYRILGSGPLHTYLASWTHTVFMAVITGTGEAAYRRGDGIYVIPIRALGA